MINLNENRKSRNREMNSTINVPAMSFSTNILEINPTGDGTAVAQQIKSLGNS